MCYNRCMSTLLSNMDSDTDNNNTIYKLCILDNIRIYMPHQSCDTSMHGFELTLDRVKGTMLPKGQHTPEYG